MNKPDLTKAVGVCKVVGMQEPVSDSGWRGYQAGRCIWDYERDITFSQGLTDEEIIEWRAKLSGPGCPGWTGVSCRLAAYVNGQYRYIFATTMDSSD